MYFDHHWFSPVSVANELLLAVAVCSVLQKPSTFLSSTCIDLLRGDSFMLYGGYFTYVIFAAAVFITCSQQHVVDVLAVASLGTSSASAAAA